MDSEFELASQYAKDLESFTIQDSLRFLWEKFPHQINFSTSFSLEDQVITHEISESQFNIGIFTLDTGRLFPETYSTWERTINRYALTIKAYYPEAPSLEEFVERNGPNSFYQSVDLRKQCCHIRKVIPLNKALVNTKVWISGLRSDHSEQRKDLKILEWDSNHQVYKFYPVFFWTENELRKSINSHGIPYNILFDKGFPSIGCAPCTRAIKPGESMRAGRWWWENPDQKECGLHETQSIQ